MESDIENETLLTKQITNIFHCATDNVELHIKNIYETQKLDKGSTSEESSLVQKDDSRIVNPHNV